jgi:2-dehydropantoate 2-reductase
MKIAVVGCGAMGSVYAALLADSGNEVLAVDPWTAHVAAINTAGLRVEGASGDRIVRLRATTVAPRETMDLVIIAAKATGIGSAAAEARSLTGPDTVVLAIQNGLGSADIIATTIGPDQLAVGIAGGFGAAMKAPGHAFHNGMEVVRIGAHAGLAPKRVDDIAALWRAAGFRTEAVADIAAMQWDKLICNVAYSAPCALTGLTVGQVIDDPDIGPVSRAAAREAWTVASARGIRIDITDPVAHVRAFGARIPNARPSLAQDLAGGRRGEIDMINGAIPREAAKVGIEAPVNATLTALVRQREAGFSP